MSDNAVVAIVILALMGFLTVIAGPCGSSTDFVRACSSSCEKNNQSFKAECVEGNCKCECQNR